MENIDTSHLVCSVRVQGAVIRTNTWVNEANRVINLLEVEVRRTGSNATINIWPESTQEVQAIIDVLTAHVQNVQTKERESIANAIEHAVAA